MTTERKINYKNHIEISECDTKMVSSVLCPLLINEIMPNQLFPDNDGNLVVMCIIEGQKLEDDTYNTFLCPYFYGAVYPFKTNLVDCRNPKYISKCQKEK